MTHLQRVIRLDIAVYEYWLNRKFSKKKKKKKKQQQQNIYLWDYSSSKKATVQSSFHLENLLINTGSEKTRLIVLIFFSFNINALNRFCFVCYL